MKKLGRFFRVPGLNASSDELKKDYLIMCCTGDSQKIVETLTETCTFEETLNKMVSIWPKLDTDLTIRMQLEKLPSLPYQPDPSAVVLMYHQLEALLAKLVQQRSVSKTSSCS